MPQAIAAFHTGDPKEEIYADVRPLLDGVAVLGARVLVAVYMRPGVTAGGLYLPDKTKDEDKFQGKVGLVLAKGPLAFQDDESHRFGRLTPEVGDWVVYSVGDTFAFELGKRRARLVEDVDIGLIIARPDSVW